MKIYTSYFYQVRNFSHNFIPFSTAQFPPSWFKNQHKDKNGVWNGISIPPLVPNSNCNGLCHGPDYCAAEPQTCAFLKAYEQQLNALDCGEIVRKMEHLAKKIQLDENFKEEPILILLVFEAPKNPCSERVVIQRWFKNNGIEVNEWHPS